MTSFRDAIEYPLLQKRIPSRATVNGGNGNRNGNGKRKREIVVTAIRTIQVHVQYKLSMPG